MASLGERVILVLSWFKTRKVALLLAIGTVNLDIPLESILAFTAIEERGLKSPSISEIAGVNAKESQINSHLLFLPSSVL